MSLVINAPSTKTAQHVFDRVQAIVREQLHDQFISTEARDEVLGHLAEGLDCARKIDDGVTDDLVDDVLIAVESALEMLG